MILGYFCKRGVFNSVSTPVLSVLCLVGISTTVGEQLFVYHHGVGYNVWYNNILLLLGTLSLFVLLSRLTLKNNKLIQLLAKYSFAIYLVHIPVLNG